MRYHTGLSEDDLIQLSLGETFALHIRVPGCVQGFALQDPEECEDYVGYDEENDCPPDGPDQSFAGRDAQQ